MKEVASGLIDVLLCPDSSSLAFTVLLINIHGTNSGRWPVLRLTPGTNASVMPAITDRTLH